MSQKQKVGDSETPKTDIKGFKPTDNREAANKAREARELLAKMEKEKAMRRESIRRGCCGCC